MSENRKVLVVPVVIRDLYAVRLWANDLCRQLQKIPLEVVEGGPVNAGLMPGVLKSQATPPVVVLAGSKPAVDRALVEWAPLLGEAAVITVYFDKGEARLTFDEDAALVVQDAVRDKVLRMIVAAAGEGGLPASRPGEVIPIGRRPREVPRSEADAPDVPEKPDVETTLRQLPSSEQSGEDSPIAQLPPPEEPPPEERPTERTPADPVTVEAGDIQNQLEKASDCVAAATDFLVELWSSKREQCEQSAVYGLSWAALEHWQERMLDLRGDYQDDAAERLRELLEMLAADTNDPTPLARISKLLDHDPIAMMFVAAVMAPELDIRFQRPIGALHDDMGRRHVSMALACAMIAASAANLSAQSVRLELAGRTNLRELRIVDGFGEAAFAADEPLRIEPPVLEWLLTGEERRLTADPAFAAILRPTPLDAVSLHPRDRREAIIEAVDGDFESERLRGDETAIILTGSEPGWIEVDVAALVVRPRPPLAPRCELRIAPPTTELPADVLERMLREAIRRARVCGKTLVVDMTEPGPRRETFWQALVPLLARCRPGPNEPRPLVISDNPALLLSLTANERIAVVTLPPVRPEHRIGAIRATIVPDVPDDDRLAAELAGHFRLPLTLLADLPALARAEAAREQRARPEARHWKAAFRTAAGRRLPELARRIPPRVPERGSPLDRVILPPAQRAQLEAIVRHVRVGAVVRDWGFDDLLDTRGVPVLFSGPSGTGKTTAAHALASALDTDLYAVDLARIVSKYIGETEKHIDRAFNEAHEGGAALLFDEADALFGKRGDAGDPIGRYANMEVGYLLQRLADHDGLVILTTNLPQNVDTAFDRRMRFIVEFPLPSACDRLKIWKHALPEGRRRSDAIDFDLAAQQLELTGGSIVAIVYSALADAAADDAVNGVVQPRHLRCATRSELIKVGQFAELRNLGKLFAGRREEAA